MSLSPHFPQLFYCWKGGPIVYIRMWIYIRPSWQPHTHACITLQLLVHIGWGVGGGGLYLISAVPSLRPWQSITWFLYGEGYSTSKVYCTVGECQPCPFGLFMGSNVFRCSTMSMINVLFDPAISLRPLPLSSSFSYHINKHLCFRPSTSWVEYQVLLAWMFQVGHCCPIMMEMSQSQEQSRWPVFPPSRSSHQNSIL